MIGISTALSIGNPIYQRRGSPPVITATTAPTLSAMDDSQTPADGYTAGTYSSTAGTISSAVETYFVNDVEVASTYDLAADDEVRVSVLVTDSVGNTRTFSTGTVTVTAVAVAADYTVTSDAEWNTVFANSDAALSGKTVELSGSAITRRTITNRTFSPALTIRHPAGHDDTTSYLTGLSLDGVDGLTCQGTHFRRTDWPGAADIVNLSGANANCKWLDCTFRHGYGATNEAFDPNATYPEYSDGSGLAAKLKDAFSAAGGTTTHNFEIRGCTFTDLGNGIKGFGNPTGLWLVWDNDFDRIYQDNISLGNFVPIDDDSLLLVARNSLCVPFGEPADDGNPHGDLFQIGSNGPKLTSQIVVAGNWTKYRVGLGSGVQDVFISDTDDAYSRISVIANMLAGNAVRGVSIGETADGADQCLVFRNTLIPWETKGVNTQIILYEDAETTQNTSVGNIAMSVSNAPDDLLYEAGNIQFSFASPTDVFPNYASWSGATALAEVRTALSTVGTSAEGQGAADDYSSLIDSATDDPRAVVKWENVHPGIGWPSLGDVPAGSTQTLPLRRILCQRSGQAVVPNAGCEWRSYDTDGATLVQDWTTASGTIGYLQYIQFRGDASATELETVTVGGTVNGFAVGADARTELVTPAQYVLTAGDGTTYFADPSNPGSVQRLTRRGKFNLPSTYDYMRFFGQDSTGCDLYYRLSDLYVKIEDSTGTILTEVAIGYGEVALNVWLDVEFDVDITAGTWSVTVNGATFTGTMGTSASFQTNRKVLFGSSQAAGNARLPALTGLADLSVDFNGVLHKELSNDAATLNADLWQLGSDVTQG